MKKVLVTGGLGYIGSHTVKLLLDKDYDVIVIDKAINEEFESFLSKAKFINVDLGDYGSLNRIFKEENIDGVIHFAAFIEAGESMKNPLKFFNNNISNTLNLLNVMEKNNVNKLVFSSTAAVYGEPESLPIKEEHPKKPVNNYGLSKLIVENILRSLSESKILRYVSLRYFNASGADESGMIGEIHDPETHLIPIILEVAKGKRKNLKVFGDDYKTKDGSCIRDYIHVNDLAKAHVLALEKIEEINQNEFNLGIGKGFSVFEVIKECEKVTGKKIPFEITKRREGDPAVLIADYSKAREVLGWKPSYNLRNIIETAWKWHNK